MGKKWNKKKLAAELAGRVRRKFLTELADAREDLKPKNIKKELQDEFAQFKRDVTHIPEAYQESWESLRETSMPNLNPAHLSGMAKRAFVSGVENVVDEVVRDFEHLEAMATITEPKRGAQNPDGSREKGTTRESAYQMLTVVWAPQLSLNISEIDDLAKTLDEKGKRFEFLRKTGHGAKVSASLIDLAAYLGPQQAKQKATCEKLIEQLTQSNWDKLPETAELTSGRESKQSVLTKCDRFFDTVRNEEERFRKKIDQTSATCGDAITFEAVKAYILAGDDDDEQVRDAKETRERAEAILGYADWGLEATEGILRHVKHVPDYHTKAVALALSVTVKCLGVLKACADKQIMSTVVSHQVETYRQTHGPKQIYKKLNEPGQQLAVAKMLADKIVKSVELSLKFAEPVVAALDKVVAIPVFSIEDIWDTVSGTAVEVVRDYEDARIELATSELKKAGVIADNDDKNPVWETVKDVLSGNVDGLANTLEGSLTGQIEKHAKSCLGEIEKHLEDEAKKLEKSLRKKGGKAIRKGSILPLILDLVSERLVGPIVQRIVKKLPTSPAQPVSGDDVQDLIASLGRNLEARGISIQRELEDYKPAHDNQGNAVGCVLSEIEGPEGQEYVEVRMADTTLGRGRVYLDNLQFVRRDDGEADPYQGLPRQDSRKREITAFRPSLKASMRGPYAHEVRIGEFWGYLDENHVFTPRQLDPTALSDWSDRIIVPGEKGRGMAKAGYRTGEGEMVPGRWYRPMTSLHLFMGNDGGHEWAASATRAGNGQNVGAILADATEVGSQQFRSIT